MKRIRKFFKEFQKPTLIGLARNGKSLAVCDGVCQFSNGWFALIIGEKVFLYDTEGNIQNKDEHLDAVYVFRNGYTLKREFGKEDFILVDGQGKYCFSASDISVFSDCILGVKREDDLWKVYSFAKENEVTLLSEYKVPNLELYWATDDHSYVLALEKDTRKILQYVENSIVQREVKTDGFLKFMFGEYFIITDEKPDKISYCDGCALWENEGNHYMSLYHKDLTLIADNISGVIAFSNGMYFLKDTTGCWTLYGKDRNDKVFLSDFYNLRTFDSSDKIDESEAASRPCLLWGDTPQNKQANIRMMSDGRLEISYDVTRYTITVEGQVFERKDVEDFYLLK